MCILNKSANNRTVSRVLEQYGTLNLQFTDTSLELKDKGEFPQNDDLQHQISYFSFTFQIQFEFKTQERFNCSLV